MSRDDNLRFICSTINTKRLTKKDRFEIALFISEEIGFEKIISKGPDCAFYLENLTDQQVAAVSAMIRELIEKNNEKLKNMC